ncbi:MAG: disulfide bond formation protein DsbB [Thiotrichales bacterium SG8_50]|nr:MAG: disulfide bond formation protein DsbB [Thiotrichales bacterium SG8_50]
MLKNLARIAASAWYWLALIGLGVAMLAIALFYQYQLDYWPCVLCIHTRIWVMAFVLVGVVGLVGRKFRLPLIIGHVLVAVTMAGLLERSWMLLGVERGFIQGSCDFNLGLPAWLALDQWFPSLFKVWEACGYTPELLFGVTMAEGLLVMSAVFALIGCLLTLSTVLDRRR